MTLDTFKSKVRSYWKVQIIRGILFFLAMGTAAAITLLVARRVNTVGFDSMAIIIVLSSYTAIAALMFYILCPLQQKQVRKLKGGVRVAARCCSTNVQVRWLLQANVQLVEPR